MYHSYHDELSGCYTHCLLLYSTQDWLSHMSHLELKLGIT